MVPKQKKMIIMMMNCNLCHALDVKVTVKCVKVSKDSFEMLAEL